MITEKYCNEILQQYPEYITKDQMYRICHISKKTCLFLLESGLVPNIDSGKKTRRFKIKTVDVIQYLKDRDDYPELFKAPDGFLRGRARKVKAAHLPLAITMSALTASITEAKRPIPLSFMTVKATLPCKALTQVMPSENI